MAGYDFDRLQRVLLWPIREVLVAYVENMHQAAAHGYERDVANFCMTAPYAKKAKPPSRPAILDFKQ